MAQHQWNRIQGCPPFGEHDRGTWWACLDCDDSLFVPEGDQQPELVNRTVCNGYANDLAATVPTTVRGP